MEKKERKSAMILDADQPPPRRSTRSNTQMTKFQVQNVNSPQAEEVSQKFTEFSCSQETSDVFTCNAADLTLNPDLRSKRMNPSLEENLLTFLDTNGNADPDETLEDKMMFLEATHSICVVPSVAHVPTPKMFQAILHFIHESHSVGLTMSSFELLTDLEKRHPRVAIKEGTSPDSCRKPGELIIDEKVWSPLEEALQEQAVPDRLLVPIYTTVSFNLFVLLDSIAQRLPGTGKPAPRKSDRDPKLCSGNYVVMLSQFMILQHLMSLIRTDLFCRLKVFDSSGDCKDFTVVRDSYICRLLLSITQQEKRDFLMNLNAIMDPTILDEEEESMDVIESGKESSDTQATTSNNKRENTTAALQATPIDFGQLASDLLGLIVKIDQLNQEFGVPVATSRRRNRFLFDTLLSIVTKASTLDAYLKAVSDPTAKLRCVIEYFINFAPKPVVQGLLDFMDCNPAESMDKLLSCFTDQKKLRGVIKVFQEADTLPLLLSHAFQAFLLLHSLEEGHSDEQIKISLQERRVTVCKSMIIALNNLQTVERLVDMLPIAEQTLFVATRISC